MKSFWRMFISLSLITLFFQPPIAQASSRAADCLELRNPTAVSTSISITLSFDVYALCNLTQLGSANMQKPLYEMPQEESLFNLNSCSGPYLGHLIGRGWLGTATCTLRIGSNTLPSPRIGAISTIVRVWFAWDFSQKEITVTHSAIPAGTNNGWGGTSSTGSGSSGTTIGGTGNSAPPKKSCTSAPKTPKLVITQEQSGVNFSAIQPMEGSETNYFKFTFAYLDAQTGKWDTWSDWFRTLDAAPFNKLIEKNISKSKVALALVGVNDCGESEQARENTSHTGVEIGLKLNQTIQISGIPPSVKISDSPLQVIASADSKKQVIAESSTKNVCRINSLVSPEEIYWIAPGDCQIELNQPGNDDYYPASPLRLAFTVLPKVIARSFMCAKSGSKKLVSPSKGMCPKGYKKKI